MARQLRAGAGQVRPLHAVARDRAPHQKLRAEEQREEGKARDGEEDGHVSRNLRRYRLAIRESGIPVPADDPGLAVACPG